MTRMGALKGLGSSRSCALSGRSFFNYKNNSRGQTLVTALLGAAIVATTVLGLSSMLHLSAKNSKGLRNTDHFNQISHSVAAILSSQEACDSVFRSQVINPSPGPIKIYEPYTNRTSVLVETGSRFQNLTFSVDLEDIKQDPNFAIYLGNASSIPLEE